MFTGIVTDVGTVRSAEQRGDLRLDDRHRLRPRHGRPRRLDRLLGRVPDRGRQGRRLVRGRRFGRNRLEDRRGSVARGRAAQPRALAAPRRRARRPYRHRPCRCGRDGGRRLPEGDSTRIGISVPRALGADDRRQGLDRARRRVADRQRGPRRRGRHDPFLGQHHPAHRAAHHASAILPPGRQLNVEIDVLARYIDRMLAARAQ